MLEVVKESKDKAGHDDTKGLLLVLLHTLLSHTSSLCWSPYAIVYDKDKSEWVEEVKRILADLHQSQATT